MGGQMRRARSLKLGYQDLLFSGVMPLDSRRGRALSGRFPARRLGTFVSAPLEERRPQGQRPSSCEGQKNHAGLFINAEGNSRSRENDQRPSFLCTPRHAMPSVRGSISRYRTRMKGKGNRHPLVVFQPIFTLGHFFFRSGRSQALPFTPPWIRRQSQLRSRLTPT